MDEKQPLSPEVLVTRLGDYLVEKGLVTDQELKQALDLQAASREAGAPPQLLGKILVQMGAIDQTELDQAVTEQIIQLKNALQDANLLLEKRVQQRTADLEQALRKLSELNQLKSNFVSNISHELRTPLTHIKGYLELLRGEEIGPLLPEQIRALSVMTRSTDRLEKLIEDLLQFSMTEPGQVTLNLQVFNLGALGRRVAAQFAAKAEAQGLQFNYEAPELNLAVKADEEKITWLIGQLLDNAIKFTPTGGEIQFSLKKEDQFVRVSVRDTGIGIPPEKIREIFEPFHQLDGGSTRRFGGTGLGLALVNNIIKAHGVALHVESEMGQGSEFYFDLTLDG